jgi:hypothetical protein
MSGLGSRWFLGNIAATALAALRQFMFAPLRHKCANTATQELRHKIADPVEGCLKENLEQQHIDDGERDHACGKDVLIRVPREFVYLFTPAQIRRLLKVNSKEPGAQTTSPDWNKAQREQYLRELDVLAEILLDFYLSRRHNADRKSDRRNFDISEHQP